MYKNRYLLIASLGLLSITAIAGALLVSSNAYADDNIVDNVSINVPISCSLEGTGMNSHNANIVNGTYQADIGTTTMKAFCNDTNGFAIYAIGYTDNEYGKTVLANSVLGSTHDIATGTATSGSTSNWAMKLATDSTATYAITLDNSFGSYHNVPTTYTKVAHRDSGTDIGTNATGTSLTSTYAAFMSQTQPAGTYTGQVKYTLVHPSSETPLQPQPAVAGYIVYHPNVNSVVGQMGNQRAYDNSSIVLWAPNFKRDGYGFAGWNDKFDYSGNFYGPQETITAPSDVSTNGLSLYAVWIKSAGSLQNWDGCSSLASGATTALTDSRDGNTYAVAKLADGKCWMIENLRLADKDSSNNDINLTSENTYNPSLPLTNIYDSSTTSNHLSPTTDPTQVAWCTTSSATCYDQSMLATNNTTLFINNITSNYDATSNVYSYGNYYNWYSATAGHGTHSKSYGNTLGDICPAGWHLPTGKVTTGDYSQLDAALGGTGTNSDSDTNPTGATMSMRWRSYPNNFVYSANLNGASFGNRNYLGDYWSSTAISNLNTYVHTLQSDEVKPARTNYTINRKYLGRMVRCIASVQL